jgi:hypothetical protein
MPWSIKRNATMFAGANWNGHVKTVSGCSPEQARRIAAQDPRIRFFFFCRDNLTLTHRQWSKPKYFYAGDAVFFTGEPWYGRTAQCDVYVKEGLSVAYVDNVTPDNLASTGRHLDEDGLPLVDIVCIFAAHINKVLPRGSMRLAPGVPLPAGASLACAPINVVHTLQSGVIKALQDKGIAVLLTFLNNHDEAGWSEFKSEDDARNFVAQLQDLTTRYKLDGIDIDDEYSEGPALPTSLPMVTSFMRRAMPDKIISKALFADLHLFNKRFQGSSLADNLTYGWEMSYGEAPHHRLPAYVDAGMLRQSLALGFWAGQPSPSPADDANWVKAKGFGGVMTYAAHTKDNATLIGDLIDVWREELALT